MLTETMVDPTTLASEIVHKLQSDPRIDASKVGVSTSTGGTVVINGIVRSYAEKCWSEELVRALPGVTAVRNELEVRLTIGDYRTDECLQRVVSDLFEALTAMPPNRPEATVRSGWVTLKGRVPCEYQRRLAEQAVSQIAGIRGIDNVITVDPS